MNNDIILRGRKIRLLPTAKEAKYLFEIAEGYRKTWNWALNVQIKAYSRRGKLLKWSVISNRFTKYLLSKEGSVLSRLPRMYLISAFQDLYDAYRRYFMMLEKKKKDEKSS